jgi:DNA mismatch repair protein MutS
MNSELSTPLMRQHAAIKKQHPSALLFFRVGDFYELFFDDAVVASRELQITLTSRNKEKGVAIPMCGVPYHAAEGYILKLVRKGYKVAICDQVEDPKLATKLVRREVTRVLTPGTAIDAQMGPEENNFLGALARHDDRVGFAALDLSTGEFRATEFRGPDAERRTLEEIQALRPRELLFASSLPLFADASASRPKPNQAAATTPQMASAGFTGYRSAETPLEDWIFAPDYAIPQLENHFGVLTLEGFGLANRPAAACAAGAILHYVRSTQRGTLDHIDRIGFYERQSCLVLDAVTVRNLELVEPLFGGTGDNVTLFRAIDQTVTPMGKRLLRAWMLRPSIDASEINLRLDAVAAAHGDTIAREELRRSLAGILDVERLLSRVTLEAANPRDVLALAASLGRVPGVRARLAGFSAERWRELYAAIDELTELRQRIEGTIVAEPPILLNDGGAIAAGVDATLDELRGLNRNSKQYIAQIEERERRRTGINSLKVRFNSVFGYYIEISKTNLRHVPAEYERKQTLVGAERFTTPELKEYETRVLDAQEKIVEIERRIFAELRSAIALEAKSRWARFAGRAGGGAQLLPSAIRRQRRPRDYRGPAPGHRAARADRQQRTLCRQRSLLERRLAPGGHSYRPEYGRQVDLSAADGADHPAGPDGLVRAGHASPAQPRGQDLHPHRGERQSGSRPFHVHGGDDGNRRHPEHGNAAIPGFAGRGRARHFDLRRLGNSMGSHRVSPRPHPGSHPVCHSLP